MDEYADGWPVSEWDAVDIVKTQGKLLQPAPSTPVLMYDRHNPTEFIRELSRRLRVAVFIHGCRVNEYGHAAANEWRHRHTPDELRPEHWSEEAKFLGLGDDTATEEEDLIPQEKKRSKTRKGERQKSNVALSGTVRMANEEETTKRKNKGESKRQQQLQTPSSSPPTPCQGFAQQSSTTMQKVGYEKRKRKSTVKASVEHKSLSLDAESTTMKTFTNARRMKRRFDDDEDIYQHKRSRIGPVITS